MTLVKNEAYLRTGLTENATHAYIHTTDIAAGEGAETVLTSLGYDDAVTFVNGFRFVDDLLAKG